MATETVIETVESETKSETPCIEIESRIPETKSQSLMQLDKLKVPGISGYQKIASHQSSWFCAEIIRNIRGFQDLLKTRGIPGIHDLYVKCLVTGSNNRRDSGSSGNKNKIETLFHPNILSRSNSSNHSFVKLELNKTKLNQGYEKMMSSKYSNYEMVMRQKSTYPGITVNGFKNILESMNENVILGIDSRMDCFIVYRYEKKFILLDPREKRIRVFDGSESDTGSKSLGSGAQDIIDYVNDTKEYNLVMIMKCMIT